MQQLSILLNDHNDNQLYTIADLKPYQPIEQVAECDLPMYISRMQLGQFNRAASYTIFEERLQSYIPMLTEIIWAELNLVIVAHLEYYQHNRL